MPGLYVAGVVVGGQHTSELFIKNGRFHGKQIVASFQSVVFAAQDPDL